MKGKQFFSDLREVFESSRIRWIGFVLCVIWLGFTIYTPSLFGPFVFDDRIIIVNGIGRDADVTLLELYSDWGRRAVGMLSFHLNYLVWGHDPFWFHVVNIAVHIVTSFLVMRLCFLLFQAASGGKPQVGSALLVASVSAGLLFLVHPIQSQAVAYIVQRFASLAALIYSAAIIWWHLFLSDAADRVKYFSPSRPNV
jgi:hypothetical protein